jgi:hypothetical protein
MRVTCLIIASALCAALAAADPPSKLDRINLTNGRSLAGTISSETADAYTITLAGGSGGAILVAKSRVLSIERGAEDLPVPSVPITEQQPVAKPTPASAADVATDEEVATVKQLREDAKKKGALVTKELFALVKPSMPLAEALAILGPGHTIEPFDPRQPNGDKTYNWRNKNGSHVRLVQNRLNQVDRIDVMTTPAGRVELP